MVKTFVDIIPFIGVVIGCLAIIDTKYQLDDTFPTILLVYVMVLISSQSLGHIVGIVFTSNPIVGAMILLVPLSIFSPVISDRDLSDFSRNLINLIPYHIGLKHIWIFFYGRDRCPEGEISSVLYKNQVYDNDFDKTTVIMAFDVCLYYILSYIFLKIKANWDSIQLIIKSTNEKIFKMLPCKSH